MSATAALSATAVASVAADGDVAVLTAALALMTGVVALVAGLLRLGFISNFVSEPVLKGFIVGMALTIIIGQVPKLFGFERGDGNFFEQAWDVVTGLGDTSLVTLMVGVLSLVLVVGLRRFLPRVPGSLVTVAVAVVAVKLFSLDEHGVSIVGHIDSGLPAFGFPDVEFGAYGHLAGAAVGVMFVGFAEGLGAARTYAAREHYDIDANRELLGLGAANLGSGLASGMVVNGSLSKTAVNGSAGARSQVSSLVVAVLTVVTLLLLTALFEDLPEATLAAVVIAAVIELVDIEARSTGCAGPRRRSCRASTASRHAPTSSPRWRPCSACSSSTRCRAWSSASGCRWHCWCTGRHDPRGGHGPGADHRAPGRRRT